MINEYRSGRVNKTYYVQNAKDFNRLDEVMSRMPSFAMSRQDSEDFVDAYYETQDSFFEEMGITVRLRTYKNKSVLSVKYSEEVLLKQDDRYKSPVHERELEPKEDLFSRMNLIFIEDKINVIYSNRLKIDIIRKIRQMREVYTVKTKRKNFEITHNSGFKTNVFFDEVNYNNILKQIPYSDLILEIIMTSIGTPFNQEMLTTFVNELRKKVVLVPMKESKYEAAILFTRFKK